MKRSKHIIKIGISSEMQERLCVYVIFELNWR